MFRKIMGRVFSGASRVTAEQGCRWSVWLVFCMLVVTFTANAMLTWTGWRRASEEFQTGRSTMNARMNFLREEVATLSRRIALEAGRSAALEDQVRDLQDRAHDLEQEKEARMRACETQHNRQVWVYPSWWGGVVYSAPLTASTPSVNFMTTEATCATNYATCYTYPSNGCSFIVQN